MPLLCFFALGKVCCIVQDGSQSLKRPGTQSMKATTAFFSLLFQIFQMTLKLRRQRQTGNRLLMGNDKQLFQNLMCYYEENKQLIILSHAILGAS